jgi:TetR/AcrR family transcriptional regulator, cholesterol catabolism regulator
MDESKSIFIILEVAERIFFQFGYTNSSVEDIAKECGISKKTIYKYFKSKEDILIECVKRRINYNSKIISNIIYSNEIIFHEKIEKIMMATSENFKDLDISFLYDIKKSCNEAWRMIEDHKFNHIPEKFTYLINEGIKNGYVKKDVKADVVSHIYLSAMSNLLDSNFFSNTSHYSFIEIVKVIQDTIFYGVIKRV